MTNLLRIYEQMNLKNIAICIFILLVSVGCGKPTTEDVTGNSKIPKLTYIINLNDTTSTYYKCIVDGNGISCGGTIQTIPTISSLELYRNAEEWSWTKVKNLPNGCFNAFPSDGHFSVDRVDLASDCNLEGRIFNGSDMSGVPNSTYGPSFGNPLYFTKAINYLSYISYQLVNKQTPGSPCHASVVSRVSASPSATSDTNSYIFQEGAITFPTLFSLGATQATRDTLTASRAAPFDFGFQPALDTSDLIANGYTDSTINNLLTPQLGDFLLLKISNGSNSWYCKAPDAIQGTITVPVSVMSNFSGTTGFNISRYKYSTQGLGSMAEITALIKVGMYTNGTDALGQSGGTVNIFIGN